jgi:hypothetical protein
LARKPEEMRPVGERGLRWVDNIKMDLVEIVWHGVYCIVLAQDTDLWRAVVNV